FQAIGPCNDEGCPCNGPCSWIVTDRSGLKYFFGDTTDSRLMVQDNRGAKIWALSRVQDLFGNFWSVTYSPDANNGQLYPAAITYTQGPGLSTYHTVEFLYDSTRTDTDHGYWSSR